MHDASARAPRSPPWRGQTVWGRKPSHSTPFFVDSARSRSQSHLSLFSSRTINSPKRPSPHWHRRRRGGTAERSEDGHLAQPTRLACPCSARIHARIAILRPIIRSSDFQRRTRARPPPLSRGEPSLRLKRHDRQLNRQHHGVSDRAPCGNPTATPTGNPSSP